MDAVVDKAVEEIALQGRAGCSLSRLWQLVDLPDALKPHVWWHLRSRQTQISFTTSALLAAKWAAAGRNGQLGARAAAYGGGAPGTLP